jgi:hypothetical protein
MAEEMPRIVNAPTAPVPLRPSPFACPMCGERLVYNFIVRKGSDDGYYLIGHDNLRIDTQFCFTTAIEKADMVKWRGMNGEQTIITIGAWCAGLHAAVEAEGFGAMCRGVLAVAQRLGIHEAREQEAS